MHGWSPLGLDRSAPLEQIQKVTEYETLEQLCQSIDLGQIGRASCRERVLDGV